MNSKRIAIIGGGAAGLFAAASLPECSDAEVVLFDKNPFFGKKLLITGKGRCNVTNDCDFQEFFANVPQNGKFLYSALRRFSPADTIEFFESCGVPLKTERGKRVFPASDKASDIRDALVNLAKKNGVVFRFEKVKKIDKKGDIFSVMTDKSTYFFEKVIVATGGVSYPGTGSTGDGYVFAKKFGHTITSVSPSLVPLVTRERFVTRLMGLSLKNVSLSIVDSTNDKTVYSDFGEMLFTHFGISGPLVLSASSYVRDINASPDRYKACIDLKPALSEEQLDSRVQRDFLERKNMQLDNALRKLLPEKIILPLLKKCGIDPEKQCNSVTKEERNALVRTVKNFSLTVTGYRPISEAIITDGGICVKEINPKTMESKLINGLHFAGEIIDVAGFTGGFNLQIAFSTGYAAAHNEW